MCAFGCDWRTLLPCRSAPLQSMTAAVSRLGARSAPLPLHEAAARTFVTRRLPHVAHHVAAVSARELGAGTSPGRHLPWGSWPFDGQQSDWSRAGLPHRRPPLAGFLTLSAACSRFCLVTIFHATAVHRLSTFRAFSARPALAPLDAGLLSCRSGSYHGPHGPGAERATSELSSGRTAVTRRCASHSVEPLLSWSFSSSRSPGRSRRPLGLPSRACRQAGAPQGLGSRSPGRGSGESRQPPRGLSPCLTRTLFSDAT